MIRCPLCDEPILGRGPTTAAVWQEMETDDQVVVVVHNYCAWHAIRQATSIWEGWEPMGLIPPYPWAHPTPDKPQ